MEEKFEEALNVIRLYPEVSEDPRKIARKCRLDYRTVRKILKIRQMCKKS